MPKYGPGRNAFAFGYFAEQFDTNGHPNSPRDFSPGVDAYGLPSRRIGNHGWNLSYYVDVPSAYFDFLVTKGKARVLTAPRATVRNAETAVFFTGEENPYLRTQNGDSPAAGVRAENQPLDPKGDNPNYPDNRTVSGATTLRSVPDVAETGVSLTVRPIIAEKTIALTVNISVVSQLGFDDEGIPMLSTRAVDTELRVAPGEEHIVGGMTRTRSIQAASKVPILGSLPVLGWLFGSENTTGKKTMVAMVLSADLVEDYSGLGAEEKETIATVQSGDMNTPAGRKGSFGFDMYLMNAAAK